MKLTVIKVSKIKRQRKKCGTYLPKEDVINKLKQYLKSQKTILIKTYTEIISFNENISFDADLDFNEISKSEILNRYFKYFKMFEELEMYDIKTIHKASLNATKRMFQFYYCKKCDDLSKYNILYNNITCNKCEQKKYLKWQKEKKKTNDSYRFICNTRALIHITIKNQGYKKNTKASKILGCDWEVFKTYIERKFTEGMSWSNYGKWHLDHIYPISKATSYEMALELNHYTNFQPLWAFDNYSKNNKIVEHQRMMPF